MTRNSFLQLAIMLCLSLLAGQAYAGWKAAERIETYNISGRSGIELYRSIGENGPLIGIGRAIAYTDFKLLWSRDYRPQQDGSCKLVSARPSLTINYKLPKAPADLPATTQRAWQVFLDGIVAHEKIHGEMIIELVRQIEAVSVGLTAANDPKCQKVRQALQEQLGPLSQEQRRKSREFDREEMSDGGNVHRLILALVNNG